MSQLGSGNGTGFPTSIDTKTTEVNSPAAGKTKARAEVVNDLMTAVVAVETAIGINPVKRVSQYASLTAAVASIGATSTTLLIDSTTYVTANTTVPSTLSIVCRRPGYIVDTAGTLTINGSFDAGLYQIFSGFSAGDITFESGPGIDPKPEWWGITGSADNVAIGLAQSSISTGKVILQNKTYYLSDPIIMKTGVNLQGSGWGTPINTYFGDSQWTDMNGVGGTVLRTTGTNNAISYASNSHIFTSGLKDLATIGTGTGTAVGISFDGANTYYVTESKLFDNVLVANFNIGVYMVHAVSNHSYSLTLRGNVTNMQIGAGLSDEGVTDTDFYRTDIQTGETGIDLQVATGINFYGGIFQNHTTTGIKFNPKIPGGVSSLSLDGFWFENNTAEWIIENGSNGISNISMSNCRLSDNRTWTLSDGDVVNNITFINDQFAGLTIDFSSNSSGYSYWWSIINTQLTNIVGLSNINVSKFNFMETLLVDIDKTLSSASSMYYNGGSISGEVTPDYRNGNVQAFTLIGNVSIMHPPSNMPDGAEITYLIVQGGSGGYTMGWQGNSQAPWSEVGNDVNKRTTITFKKVAAAYYQTSSQVPYY